MGSTLEREYIAGSDFSIAGSTFGDLGATLGKVAPRFDDLNEYVTCSQESSKILRNIPRRMGSTLVREYRAGSDL